MGKLSTRQLFILHFGVMFIGSLIALSIGDALVFASITTFIVYLITR